MRHRQVSSNKHRSAFTAQITQHFQVGLDLGQEDHPHCRPPKIDTVFHPCELRRKFAQLRLIWLHKKAHVIIHKGQLPSHSDVVLQLDIDCALMLDQTSEVSKKQVLSQRQSTDFQIECAIAYKPQPTIIISPSLQQQQISTMMAEETSIFPKQLKLDDYGEFAQGNLIRILESSNFLIGSGARTSQAAIVLAKTLHFLHEQGTFPLNDVTFLDLGSGAGLLGIYLSCLGSNVVLADLPSVRDLAQRNISLNKSMIRGKIQFFSANWKRQQCIGKCQEMQAKSSTSSERRQECLLHLIPKINYTIVCECGGLSDLQHQLRWIGKEGMIVCFLERQFNTPEDYLDARTLQAFLIEKDLNYQRIQGYHPDYYDQRVKIYRIFR